MSLPDALVPALCVGTPLLPTLCVASREETEFPRQGRSQTGVWERGLARGFSGVSARGLLKLSRRQEPSLATSGD
jgi:hypothetical protein